MVEPQFLKSRQHYIDLYDLFTIKKCLETIEMWRKIYQDSLNAEELKHLPKEKKDHDFDKLFSEYIYHEVGERYRTKEETIKKWLDKDQIKQDRYDHALEPRNIYCSCGSLMHSTFKDLADFTDQPLRILFFFECPKCKKRKGIYENGEEFSSKPNLCPKCSKEVKTTHNRKGDTITWTTACPSCGFNETKTDNLEKDRAEWKKKEEEDKKLLEEFRDQFCLSEEKGQEYLEYAEALKYAKEVYEEEKSKFDNSSYQAAVQSKKLGIVELEKLLNEALEKQNYIKLSLEKPEMSQFVIVPFSVQDADSSRKQITSINTLKKLIQDTLEGTNWKLISEGVDHRLGYMSGRLRGYEREEDLMELSGKKKQKSTEDDYDRRMKYGSNPMVQLARLNGKYDGINNTRKKRLEAEPEGFFLSESEGPYTCAICRQNFPGNKVWWNLDGLRCADCWRNIQEGVIPSLTYDKEGVWIEGHDIKSEYSIPPITRKKLEREGILHGRHLRLQSGAIYRTIYLVEENKEFFEKYPKKPELNIQITWSDEQKSLMLNVKKNEYPNPERNQKEEK